MIDEAIKLLAHNEILSLAMLSKCQHIYWRNDNSNLEGSSHTRISPIFKGCDCPFEWHKDPQLSLACQWFEGREKASV